MSDSNSFKDIRNFLKAQQENDRFDMSSNQDDATLEKLWSLSDEALASPDFNSDQAWTKFKAENHFPEKTRWVRAVTISAVIIAAILSFYLIFKNSNQENPGFTPAIATEFNVEENLLDGSLLALVSADDLEIDPEFSATKRSVRLSGNAYCNIQSDPEHPFEIITDQGVIKVYGTAFLIEQEEGTLQVSVYEGIVEITHPSQLSLSCKIKKGEKATLFNNEQAILFTDINSLDNTLILSNTKVKDALRLLDQNSPLSIRLESNMNDLDCPITSRWSSSSPNEWQEELSLLFNAKITIEKEEILVSGLNCEE